MTNYNERLDEIFKTSPINKEVPEDIWETIYATWTGLWTDGYGEWDEKQPSDIYPLDELLSTQARDRLKQAITSLTKELVAEAKPERQPPMKMGNPTKESSDLDKMIFAKKKGHNEAIDQFEQNLLKTLEEVK